MTIIASVLLFSFSVFNQLSYMWRLVRTLSPHLSFSIILFLSVLPSHSLFRSLHTLRYGTMSVVIEYPPLSLSLSFATYSSAIFLHRVCMHQINWNHTKPKNLINYKWRNSLLLTTQCYMSYVYVVCIDRH